MYCNAPFHVLKSLLSRTAKRLLPCPATRNPTGLQTLLPCTNPPFPNATNLTKTLSCILKSTGGVSVCSAGCSTSTGPLRSGCRCPRATAKPASRLRPRPRSAPGTAEPPIGRLAPYPAACCPTGRPNPRPRRPAASLVGTLPSYSVSLCLLIGGVHGKGLRCAGPGSLIALRC
eukprot:3364382-Rhodomonas_salina.5